MQTQMARYYFHLHDELDVTDEEGQELGDLEAAIARARIYALDLAAEHVRGGSLNLSHFIAVTDEAGATVAKVTFGDAVRIGE